MSSVSCCLLSQPFKPLSLRDAAKRARSQAVTSALTWPSLRGRYIHSYCGLTPEPLRPTLGTSVLPPHDSSTPTVPQIQRQAPLH